MSGAFWWSVLRSSAVFLLAGSLGIILSVMAARRKGIDVRLRDILKLTADLIRFTASRMAANVTTAIVISFLLFGALCWSHGYFYRDHQLHSNEHELLGMSILKEYPAGNYDAATETGTSFPFNPCPDSPRLAVGYYRMVKWEQRKGCKFVTYWLPKPDPTTGAIADVR